MGKIFNRAVNPSQYDLPTVCWNQETANSPFRKFYKKQLGRVVSGWKNKHVLDVGFGTGWLMDELNKEGATLVEGVDSSEKNFLFAKTNFPQLNFFNTIFEEYNSSNKYDFIIALMVFGHIKDLNKAFRNARGLLKPKGKLILVVPDFEYYREKEAVENIGNGIYATQTQRKSGIISDVVREVWVYEEIAECAGLTLNKAIPIKPSAQLIKEVPQYKKLKKTPIAQMLVLGMTLFIGHFLDSEGFK